MNPGGETMADLAIVTVSGRVAKSPEMSYTPDGLAVTRITLASNYYVKKEQKTSWYYLTFWRKQAENVNEFVVKGQQLYVVGNLSIEDWQGKDGSTRTSAKISVIDVSFGAKPKVATSDEPPIDMDEVRVF
jgi:single-strand DNA-binding protein